MLQRTPTYMVSRPAKDWLANSLRAILPDMTAYRITRWRNIAMQRFAYNMARKRQAENEQALARHGAQTATCRLSGF